MSSDGQSLTVPGRPAILLLPGMMLDGRMWRAQAEALHSLVTPVIGDITGGDSMAAIARNLLATAPPRFHLAGFSMGAIVGLEVWRQAPERVISLMLMSFSPRADARGAGRHLDIERARSGGLRKMIRDDFAPTYFAKPPDHCRDLIEEVVQIAVDLGPQVFQRQSLAQITRPDSLPTLSTITVPTLIVSGREDRLAALAEHKLTHQRIRDSRLHVFENCGHMLTLERPDAVSMLMRDFIESLSHRSIFPPKLHESGLLMEQSLDCHVDRRTS